MKKNATLALTASLVLIVMAVCFGFNSAVLDEQTRQELDDIADQLDSLSDYTVHVSGHTDNTGSDRYNDALSKERAIAVKNYLISKHVDSTKIALAFYGEQQPLVPNTSEENRALNPRVEVTISGQKRAPAPEETALPEQPKPDAVQPREEDPALILPEKQELKKKKVRRRLVWTGWKTGFHWSTSGRR